MNNTKDILDILDEDDLIVKNQLVKRNGRGNQVGNAGGCGVVSNEDTTRFLQHAMQIRQFPKIDLDKPEFVENRINEYLQLCINNQIRPTVVGLANSLGISRNTLYNRVNNLNKTGNKESAEKLKEAYSLLEELWESYMINGKVNPVTGIFLAKNNFGYKDQQDVVVKPYNPLEDERSIDDIKDKYIEANAEYMDDDK